LVIAGGEDAAWKNLGQQNRNRHPLGMIDMTHPPTTVLIAEDDPVFRRVMGFSIARMGLTVESVSNGQEAYQRIGQGGIHFLVTDHQMPVCSGLELLEKLNADSDIECPPVILCTAKGLELDSQGLQSRYRLVAVMHKPFSPRKLGDLILRHIDSIDPATPPTLRLDHPAAEAANVETSGDG
jgi:CheY-like chemotaxis protein